MPTPENPLSEAETQEQFDKFCTSFLGALFAPVDRD